MVKNKKKKKKEEEACKMQSQEEEANIQNYFTDYFISYLKYFIS